MAPVKAHPELWTDIARWYQPLRRETPEQLSELYSALVLRMIAA